MISRIKYVVVSTPRSATGWTSQVLCAMGLKCGHEKHFTHDQQLYESEIESDCTWGDSSWLAAPFLDKLPPSTMVLHQVRDPCATIASLVGLAHFSHWVRLLDEYHIFMQAHLPRELPAGLNAIQRAAHFWLIWNTMIEEAGRRIGWPWYVRYRVETPNIPAIYHQEITGHQPTDDQVRKASEIPTDFNSKPGRIKPVVTMDLLPAPVAELARRYGYG